RGVVRGVPAVLGRARRPRCAPFGLPRKDHAFPAGAVKGRGRGVLGFAAGCSITPGMRGLDSTVVDKARYADPMHHRATDSPNPHRLHRCRSDSSGERPRTEGSTPASVPTTLA